MVDLFQPHTRYPAAALFDDIHAAQAMVSQNRRFAQCKPNLPLPPLTL